MDIAFLTVQHQFASLLGARPQLPHGLLEPIFVRVGLMYPLMLSIKSGSNHAFPDVDVAYLHFHVLDGFLVCIYPVLVFIIYYLVLELRSLNVYLLLGLPDFIHK